MTPEELDEITFRIGPLSSSLAYDCQSLIAALRTAWAERDALTIDHAMREGWLLKERDSRPDAATVAKVVELLRGIEDGPMSNAAAKLIVEALRLLEKP